MRWLFGMLRGLLVGLVALPVATGVALWRAALARLRGEMPAEVEERADATEAAVERLEGRGEGHVREAAREEARRPRPTPVDVEAQRGRWLAALRYTTAALHHPHRPRPSLDGLPEPIAERVRAVRGRSDLTALHEGLKRRLGVEATAGWWDGPPMRRPRPEPEAVTGYSI